MGRVFAAGLVALAVLYGAVLRFDALTLNYGPVERPAWLRVLQQSRASESLLRPDSVTWTPVVGRRYISDPYTYLQYAGEMRSFYAAHRREPLFPFVTKVFLRLLNHQDVAVSFASASFSVLAIIATFLLGSYAFSYGVGLGAALLTAIEYNLISWGVGGWRDDAFTCAVVLSCYAMLRFSRVPSNGNAMLLGVVSGLSCLIRITSLSFLVPGLAYVWFTSTDPWRARLKTLGVSVILMIAIVGPFLFNCWRTFGDPLYAINVHADVYRVAEGQAVDTSLTAAEYLKRKARSQPMHTLDTVVLGMTSYPFVNKWQGFDRWVPSSGKWLSRAAMLGLFLFLGSSTGRGILLVLAASLVPYAATWRLISDWRFTEHAYPFFLIAACFAIGQVVSLLAPARIATLMRPSLRLKPALFWASMLTLLAGGWWIVTRVLPVLTIRESLSARQDVTIMAGDRDASFFVEGWSRAIPGTNVTTRVSDGAYSVVRVPLPAAEDYGLTVRLDPFPRPAEGEAPGVTTVRVFANDRLVAILDLGWNPHRVGAYDIHIPRDVARSGFNRLAFMTEPKPSGARFSIWYVRVRPRAS